MLNFFKLPVIKTIAVLMINALMLYVVSVTEKESIEYLI
jgi:hypothetical protein